ncbi:TPA: SocA family protein [Vibrio vulnificus]|nr:SocA family protein [Vibrio vulnificus]
MTIYEAEDIANWFINYFDQESGDVITHLKVQKLLYYAEAWTQLLLDRELFKEDMEAWAHGPVVRSVYNAFRGNSWDPLQATREAISIDSEVENVLLQVVESYGEASAKTLERMTHNDEPWIAARGDAAPEERCNTVISKAHIKQYFVGKYGSALNG